MVQGNKRKLHKKRGKCFKIAQFWVINSSPAASMNAGGKWKGCGWTNEVQYILPCNYLHYAMLKFFSLNIIKSFKSLF